MNTTTITYDVHFNDNENSDSMGFKYSADEAAAWINSKNGTGYFKDYIGGTVSIVSSEGNAIFETEII